MLSGMRRVCFDKRKECRREKERKRNERDRETEEDREQKRREKKQERYSDIFIFQVVCADEEK